MGKMNPKVDVFLKNAEKWREETEKLRTISLRCGLTEELKWGKPCYTFQESNVLIIQGFKEYFAVMFCKGALLKDPHGLLVKPGEHTQAARQMRFANVREIRKSEPILKAYIQEAVDAEENGLEVKFKKNPEPIPEELQSKLDENRALKTAFFTLTAGRRRAYILFFSGAKQSKTRESRIEKHTRQILHGRGLNDYA